MLAELGTSLKTDVTRRNPWDELYQGTAQWNSRPLTQLSDVRTFAVSEVAHSRHCSLASNSTRTH